VAPVGYAKSVVMARPELSVRLVRHVEVADADADAAVADDDAADAAAAAAVVGGGVDGGGDGGGGDGKFDSLQHIR